VIRKKIKYFKVKITGICSILVLGFGTSGMLVPAVGLLAPAVN